MIAVKGVGDTADRPVRVTLAPDSLAQGQRRLNARGRWRVQAEGVAGHGAAVVVEYDREPRACGSSAFVEDRQVERRVIGLPDLIRSRCLAPIQELESVCVHLRAIMCK